MNKKGKSMLSWVQLGGERLLGVIEENKTRQAKLDRLPMWL